MCVPGRWRRASSTSPPRDGHVAGSNRRPFMRTDSASRGIARRRVQGGATNARSDAANDGAPVRCEQMALGRAVRARGNPETTRVRRRVGVRARRETRAREMARRRRGASRRGIEDAASRAGGRTAEWRREWSGAGSDSAIRPRRRRRVGVVRGGSRRNATRSGSVPSLRGVSKMSFETDAARTRRASRREPVKMQVSRASEALRDVGKMERSRGGLAHSTRLADPLAVTVHLPSARASARRSRGANRARRRA